MKKQNLSSDKYKLTCPNKKCKYMITSGKDATGHLHQVLKRCPVCKTKYKKSDIPFLKCHLSKKKRLEYRKQIFKMVGYKKKRFLLTRPIFYIIENWLFIKRRIKMYMYKVKTLYYKIIRKIKIIKGGKNDKGKIQENIKPEKAN